MNFIESFSMIIVTPPPWVLWTIIFTLKRSKGVATEPGGAEVAHEGCCYNIPVYFSNSLGVLYLNMQV